MNPQELERLKKTKLRNMIINGQRKHLHELFVDIYGEQIYHGSVKSAAELISEDIGVKIRPFTIRGLREKKMIQNQLSEHSGNVNTSFSETPLTNKDSIQKDNSFNEKLEFLKTFKPLDVFATNELPKKSGFQIIE
jgi:hypothetical protein